MSEIRFRCPACHGKLAVDKAYVLDEMSCPKCRHRIRPWGAEMIDVRFRCPSCHGKLTVDRRWAGQSCSCPKCGADIRIPAPAVPKDGPDTGTSNGQTLISDDEMLFLMGHGPGRSRSPGPS
jgi:uncharacterized protein YbaR (Trm112 family)